jgi:hypothetical protein
MSVATTFIAFGRALIIYLPTTAICPNAMFAISTIFLLNKHAFRFKEREAAAYLLILLFVILATINLMNSFSLDVSKSTFSFIPNGFFWIFLIPFCKTVDRRTIMFIVVLIGVEIIFGFLLFVQERQTFFSGMERGIREFGSEGLMYYSRVFGLSANSSDFSYKIFAAILLTSMICIQKKYRILLNLLFVGGLFVTFNRSIIAATCIFFVLYCLISAIKRGFKINVINIAIFFFIGIIPLTSVAVYYYREIFEQLARGHGEINFSGERIFIWKMFLQEGMNNLMLGNGSNPLWIAIGQRIYHAHNSFIQLYATHGLPLTVLLLMALGIVLTRRVLVIILPIVAISMFQYGVFWNYSIIDFVFFFTLFKFSGEPYLYTNNNIFIDKSGSFQAATRR